MNDISWELINSLWIYHLLGARCWAEGYVKSKEEQDTSTLKKCLTYDVWDML